MTGLGTVRLAMPPEHDPVDQPVHARYGAFVIHRPYEADQCRETSWCITHEASGIRVAKILTLNRARALAKAVQALAGGWVDVDLRHPETLPNYAAVKAMVREAVNADRGWT